MSQLINKIKSVAKGEKPMPVLQTDAKGGRWFNELPPNARVAIEKDFLDHNGNYVNKKPYLIESEQTPGRFWVFRSKPGFELRNDFDLFLERGRIYVFEKK